tara:strand:- start:171 stop:1436 length:1266 start_codon:yes stop_codon:yes gene_type:complete
MKLQNLVARLEKHHKKKIDLSLDRTFSLLKKLGNPHQKLKNIITVVGTNSKASMAYSLKSILNEAGYKCNLYTSPHLQSYTERFIFNDEEIDKENLMELLSDVEKILGNEEATLFEILTCAYLKYAENYKSNINIIEAGLFHQFDSTNVFKENLLTLIGYINLDHISWLKNKTIDGIIHEKTTKLLNSNIFVNQQENKEISLKIKNALNKNLSKKFFFGKDFNICRRENSFIQYQDHLGEIIIPEPNLLGDHQLGNISTSIAASRKLFNVKDDHIKKGVTKIELKGRLQEIKSGKLKKLVGQNRLIVDGGHNIGASKAISNWIKNQNQDVHIIVGMMKDKSHKEFIDCFKNIVKSIQLVDIPNQKGAISKEEFKNKLEKSNINISLANSIEESLKSIAKYQNSIGICTGSLYLTGEVLNLN